jgi:DNA-binding MarR family transcriptional regulator
MMSAPLRRRHPSPCPEETPFVEMSRTVDLLARGTAQLLRTEELSSPQYNVLRILRGAPEDLLCGQISDRMITRDPDITRLLDRLEKRRLIQRTRQNADRRRVLVHIAPDGLALLARLDKPMCELHRRQLGHLGAGRLRQLESLLRACRPPTA